MNQHRFLTTAHIFELLFADHATDQSGQRCCRRVLARLVRDRVLEHLERRIGGVRAGSASYVFRVGLTGDQLLRLRAGEGSRARRKEPSARHLDHCLAVADCHVTLQRLARTSGTELLRAETEPRCWREFSDLGGTPQILKPDLYAVTASDEFEDHWFLEVDRATESLPTVLRQCSAYQLYRDSGAEQARLGLFPRVLWSVPTPARARAITEAVRRQARLDAGLFRVLTLDQLPAVIGEGAA